MQVLDLDTLLLLLRLLPSSFILMLYFCLEPLHLWLTFSCCRWSYMNSLYGYSQKRFKPKTLSPVDNLTCILYLCLRTVAVIIKTVLCSSQDSDTEHPFNTFSPVLFHVILLKRKHITKLAFQLWCLNRWGGIGWFSCLFLVIIWLLLPSAKIT